MHTPQYWFVDQNIENHVQILTNMKPWQRDIDITHTVIALFSRLCGGIQSLLHRPPLTHPFVERHADHTSNAGPHIVPALTVLRQIVSHLA